ncbi:hypothetical protein [Nocardia sp. NPDC058480]|uniref:hypothetical protein n=1 Tax=Nocardia sp. NPDC058480 TaxID=3346522 RepID=UPI003662FA9C
MPWYEVYDNARAARMARLRNDSPPPVLAPTPSPPAPVLPPPDPEPVGRGLLGWIVALITTR